MEGALVYPGKKICSPKGTEDGGLALTQDYLPGTTIQFEIYNCRMITSNYA